MEILEGKSLSNSIFNSLPARVNAIVRKVGRKPKLAIVNYFPDSASSFYMNIKVKKCTNLGIESEIFKTDVSKGQKEFLKLIEKLGQDKNIDAIMVEKPLPEGYDNSLFWDIMPGEKDVDCLSSINTGRLFLAKKMSEIESANFFVPCTALAVVKILKHYNISVAGKKVCVVGRSSVVGKPLAFMFTAMDATTTICHSATEDIEFHLKSSDIIALAIGKPKWLKENMVSGNQIIIDIGTNFDENGKMVGDADFEGLKKKVKAITPVPGGVGPVTLACLIEAVVRAAERRSEL